MDRTQARLRRLIERVRAASASRTALAIRGGGTKAFYGGAVSGELLELSDLAGISSYEPTELVVTALAGTPLEELEATLARRGQCLPFEPPRFGHGGTVGGMVAAGLAGPARGSAGGLRDYVLGVSVLDGTGELMTFGGQVMKNVAGYDVSRVFAGSMGILGIICEVSLKVMPVAPACATLDFELDEVQAILRLNRWAGMPFPLNASAWHRGRLRLRVAGASAAVDEVRRRSAASEVAPEAAAAWWDSVRDHRHDYFRLSPSDLARGESLWRVAVPDTAPPLDLPGDQFIEWGGAQRWLRGPAEAPQIRAAAAQRGGHATLIRAADKSCGVFTPLPAVSMTLHRRLKQSFDPAGIFNPGRLYPEL